MSHNEPFSVCPCFTSTNTRPLNLEPNCSFVCVFPCTRFTLQRFHLRETPSTQNEFPHGTNGLMSSSFLTEFQGISGAQRVCQIIRGGARKTSPSNCCRGFSEDLTHTSVSEPAATGRDLLHLSVVRRTNGPSSQTRSVVSNLIGLELVNKNVDSGSGNLSSMY